MKYITCTIPPLFIALACLLCSNCEPAVGATIGFHLGSSPPPPLTLSPTNPTSSSVISYVARTDGFTYPNSCYAANTEGDPSIVVDNDIRVIQVVFAPPPPPGWICFDIWEPVNGVSGQVEPLSAGTWLFKVMVPPYPVVSTFYVSELPKLSLQALPSSGQIELSWPLMNTTFILESSVDCKAGWQTVTNAPVLVNNQNTVRLDQGPDRQFFRLRRL